MKINGEEELGRQSLQNPLQYTHRQWALSSHREKDHVDTVGTQQRPMYLRFHSS